MMKMTVLEKVLQVWGLPFELAEKVVFMLAFNKHAHSMKKVLKG